MGSPISSADKYDVVPRKKAIILYPSLLTPQVITNSEDWIEVILLAEKGGVDLQATNVAFQMRIGLSLKKEKNNVSPFPIPVEWINVNKVEENGEEKDINDANILETDERFKGIVHDEFINVIKDKDYVDKKDDYGEIYRVNINTRVLDDGIEGKRSVFNMWWAYHKKDYVYPSRQDETLEEEPEVFEPQDQVMQNVLEEMNGNIPGGGKYGFGHGRKLGVPSEINWNVPVQSYHPVFYISDITAANIGHITDLHLCARQHVMRHNPAQVIEGASADISPPVGEHVNVNRERFFDLLFKIGNDPDIDILLIGGDIADYIESLYPGEELSKLENDPTVKKVWDLLKLDDEYKNRYHNFVDFISFYTLILSFCRDIEKPVFIVSGNHDAYHEPYGISPRFLGTRANPSIPADHNMTFYEAILCFGDTYGKSKSGIKEESVLSFKKEMFRWFYTVFTPFSDYGVRLPKQWIVGLEWGSTEDIIGIDNDSHSESSWTHVPRTDRVLRDSQKDLLHKITSTDDDNKIILNTHFTFVSYGSKEPIYSERTGAYVNYDSPPTLENHHAEYIATPYDIGTFEKRRKFIYKQNLLDKRNIQLILTGHTHRRGLYTIEEPSQGFRRGTSVLTKYWALEDFDTITTDAISAPGNPYIVVSDSAGPLPVYNYQGELAGHGRAYSGGTKIVFEDDSGDIKSIDVVRSDCTPRFPVVLDYIDIVSENHTVIQEFSAPSYDHKTDNFHLKFYLQLDQVVEEVAQVSEIYLYAKNNEKWLKVEFSNTVENTWVPDSHYDIAQLKKIISSNYIPKSTNSPSKYFRGRAFIAMSFEKRNDIPDHLFDSISHYEFDSFWCFPVVLKKRWKKLQGIDGFYIERVLDHDKSSAEIPDFDWLKSELYK